MFKELFLESKNIKDKILTESWDAYKKDLEKIVKKYKKYEAKDSSVPSAPDTSRFRATKGGQIELRENETLDGGSYGIDRFLPYAVIVGSNVDRKIRDKIEKDVEKVSEKHKDSVTIGNDPVYFLKKSGSAYSTFGLGN
jgi:hypothetical protein